MGNSNSQKELEEKGQEDVPGIPLPQVKVLLLGPIMSGRHTQSQLLFREKEKICYINAREMIKKEMDNGTAIGKKLIKAREKKGDDDDAEQIALDLIVKKIDSPECKTGFILNDFPTSVPAAKMLDKMLEERDRKLDTVIKLDVKSYAVVDRFLGCLVHPASGRRYHEFFLPPKKPNTDNITGKQLEPCIPLTEPEFRHLSRAYSQTMKPVENYYNSQGRLKVIDGDRQILQVYKRIKFIILDDIAASLARIHIKDKKPSSKFW